MTERDIRGHLLTIAGAVKTDNPEVALDAALALVAQVFVDLNRRATALEHLARLQGVKYP